MRGVGGGIIVRIRGFSWFFGVLREINKGKMVFCMGKGFHTREKGLFG